MRQKSPRIILVNESVMDSRYNDRENVLVIGREPYHEIDTALALGHEIAHLALGHGRAYSLREAISREIEAWQWLSRRRPVPEWAIVHCLASYIAALFHATKGKDREDAVWMVETVRQCLADRD